MKTITAALLFALLTAAVPLRAAIYATASGSSTSTFGTLNLSTGVFTQIATESVSITSLTTGTNGTIYGGATNYKLYSLTTAGATTAYGSASAPTSGYPGFIGLAATSSGSFLGISFTSTADTQLNLYSIAAGGGSSTSVGTASTNSNGSTGDLAYGPNGTLYFNTDASGASTSTLYTVNPTTGALTMVGSGLGSPELTLVSDGTTLYGINTSAATNIGIYTINTTTGVATATGKTVTGLASGFTLDTATSAVPEPAT